MIRKPLALMLAVAFLAAACGDDSGGDASEDTAAPATTEAEADGEDSLLAGVPEVANATQEGEESIQEGGVHIFGTIDGDPGAIVADYEEALEANGWTVEGSGGDPTGEFGAGVQATAEDGRYLSLNVGGPADGQSFGDLCVWPTQPSDTQCGDQDDQQDDQQDEQDDQQDDDGGPPPGVEGFIPDEVEGFIP